MTKTKMRVKQFGCIRQLFDIRNWWMKRQKLVATVAFFFRYPGTQCMAYIYIIYLHSPPTTTQMDSDGSHTFSIWGKIMFSLKTSTIDCRCPGIDVFGSQKTEVHDHFPWVAVLATALYKESQVKGPSTKRCFQSILFTTYPNDST